MTTSVRFCLSYDPQIWDVIAFKMHYISRRKHIVDMDVVDEVTKLTCTRQILIMIIQQVNAEFLMQE